MKKRAASGLGRNDRETRDRLLQASEQLFAARGFRDVTVRDICRAARANVAAVNYHFGDKLGLYREVLQVAIDAMRETNEAGQRAAEGQPAAEKLRRYIAIFCTACWPGERDDPPADQPRDERSDAGVRRAGRAGRASAPEYLSGWLPR